MAYSINELDSWPFYMLIEIDGEPLIQIGRHSYSTEDTITSVVKRPENIEQYIHITRLIDLANNASSLEAELTAARAAAGIDAGEPLDEWIKAQRADHAEMTRRRDEPRDAHDRGAILALFDHHDGDHHKWNSMTDFSCQARAQYAELISSIKEATKQIEIDGALMRESEALIEQLNSEIAYLRSTDHAADLAFERAQKIGATYVIDETPLGQLLDGQGDEVEP